MLKLSMVLMLSAAMAIAGPSTIAQSKITAGNGQQLATGKITITASAPFLAADGTWVDTTPLIVPVINGAFSVQLEPTDTAIPSNASYFAKWQLDGAAPRTDTWVIPTSSLVLTVSNVYRPAMTAVQYANLLPHDWSINIAQPATADTGMWQYQSSTAYTLVGVACSVDTGTAAINLDVRAASAPNTPGANVLPASLVCVSTGTVSGQPASAIVVPASMPVNLQILAVSGSPGVVRVYVQTN